MNIRFLFNARAFAMMIGVGIFALSTAAQKAPLAGSANLDHCENGSAASPVGCTASGDWGNGNANASNSHWAENQFLAYRMTFSGLTPGAAVHTLTISYDAKQGSPHALDYIGTFNATEATANPCAGISGCTLGSPTSTIVIPLDTTTVINQINPNTGLPVVQTPGLFTMWGGNLLTVAYEPYGGGDIRQITLTFTASVANPVIGWGGHVAWIGDWGLGNSASGIGGSPYHMRLGSFDGTGGSQSHQLAAAAVTASGAVFIKNVVNTLDATGSSSVPFPFTATGNFGAASFSLIDDNAGPGVDTQLSQTITNFGPTNTITVTEGVVLSWTLANVNCVESGIQNSSKNVLGPASIVVELGEVVTCTFTNTQLSPSAAVISISGRVTTAGGRGVRNVRVKVIGADGIVLSAVTSNFGYYRLEVESGQTYVVTPVSKRFQFSPRLISPTDELADLDFMALE